MSVLAAGFLLEGTHHHGMTGPSIFTDSSEQSGLGGKVCSAVWRSSLSRWNSVVQANASAAVSYWHPTDFPEGQGFPLAFPAALCVFRVAYDMPNRTRYLILGN